MQRPDNVPINKVLLALSEKIAQLELENVHLKATLEVYEETFDSHECMTEIKKQALET